MQTNLKTKTLKISKSHLGFCLIQEKPENSKSEEQIKKRKKEESWEREKTHIYEII